MALVGTVEPQNCIRRSGADLGDVIAVTGMLGGSFESGRHLDFVPRIHEARFLVENASLSAMMDLSDGLGSDLPETYRGIWSWFSDSSGNIAPSRWRIPRAGRL